LSGAAYDATQGTAANQPLLSGAGNKENRLPYSTNPASPFGASPQGTSWSGNKIVENTANALHYVQRDIVTADNFSFVAGRPVTFTAEIKPDGRSAARMTFINNNQTNPQIQMDLTGAGTATVITGGASVTATSIELVDDGY